MAQDEKSALSEDMNVDVLDFEDLDAIINLMRQSSPEEAFPVVETWFDRHGFDGVLYGDGAILAGDPSGRVITTYDAAWSAHYVRHGYGTIDPVVQKALRSIVPFTWSDVEITSSDQDRLMNEAGEFGIFSGVGIPLHTPGAVACFGAASSFLGQDEVDDMWPYIRGNAAIVAAAFEETVMRMDRPVTKVRLTAREKECLTWTARGKSAWDVGTILSISEGTVRQHVKSCIAKLDASGRTEAVVKALAMNFISP